MYIEFSEEQNMLRDSADKYLRENYSFDGRQVTVKSTDSFNKEQWQSFADLGWLAMTFKEEDGGFGGGALETMLLCELFGKYLVLEPYLETVVLVGSLIEASASEEIKKQYLAALISGDIQGALAYLEPSNVTSAAHVETLAVPSDSGYSLSGKKTVVLNGAAADVILVTARTSASTDEDDGISLFAVPADAAGISMRKYKTYDGRGACELTLDQVFVGAETLVGPVNKALPLLNKAIQRATLGVSAEAVGAMEALLNATVEYTTQRKQFGQAISSFQVLRHRMADMFIEVELCRSLLMATAWKMDNSAADTDKCVSALKAKIGKSASFVANNAIQLHGGIGMTDELSVGHYFKRLAAIGVLFGSSDYHLAQYSE
ncbi:MAG: acyl-CoA dehydrogenase family protein [Spongiibacteraceae bacterium]